MAGGSRRRRGKATAEGGGGGGGSARSGDGDGDGDGDGNGNGNGGGGVPVWLFVCAVLIAGICGGVLATLLVAKGGGGGVERATTAPVPQATSPPPPPTPYSWAKGDFECTEASVRFDLSDAERVSGELSPARTHEAARVFRECGVVAIVGAIPRADVDALRAELYARMDPILHSRTYLRTLLKHAMVNRVSLRSLWSDARRYALPTEPILSRGNEYRERNDGRIDMHFALRAPFDVPSFVANTYAQPILRAALGDELRLKSIHTVTALTRDDGVDFQHWHRDNEVLFQASPSFAGRNVHATGGGGVHEPPSGINQFVPLVDYTAQNGPTEFALGSHMWGETWRADGLLSDNEAHGRNVRLYVPAGTVVLMDYRTIHRGTVNRSGAPRPMAMYIYGRRWWQDTENYDGGDYGGFARALGDTAVDDLTDQVRTGVYGSSGRGGGGGGGSGGGEGTLEEKERLFWGLVNRWEAGIQRELGVYESAAAFNADCAALLEAHGRAHVTAP